MDDAVELVPLSADHLARTREWLHDPTLRGQIDSLGFPDEADHERYWRGRLADPSDELYAVVAGGEHVGNCGLRVDLRRRKAELWLFLATGRGQGVGRRAVERLLGRAFDELQLNRVFLRVVASNDRALRFWRALGFVDEGRWREDTWVDGSPTDSLWLGMLARERRA